MKTDKYTTSCLALIFLSPCCGVCGFSQVYSNVNDHTLKGSVMQNQLLQAGDYTPAQAAAVDAAVQLAYPQAQCIGGATYYYNCHGLWFDLDNLGWLPSPNPSFTDGSYWTWKTGTGNFSQGVILYFNTFIHTCKVTFWDDSGKLAHTALWDSTYDDGAGVSYARGISKWSSYGTYIHRFQSGFHPYDLNLKAILPYWIPEK